MSAKRWSLLAVGLLALAGGASSREARRERAEELPPVAREFRGVWIATVANIDWPSKPGLPVPQQQAELLAILDRAAGLNFNAVVFQVRPACDALYASRHEPWSEYLTGTQGQAPEPFYDPLAFAVEEAHRRGMELHAWINPYRARHTTAKSAPSPDHVSQARPELVRTYGKYLWLDPGDRAVQDHSLRVARDIVRRYDVDGIHMDDYFYPYKERDAAQKIIPFPDDPSWDRYVRSGGKLPRDDWRRENVNRFVERLYRAVHKEKSWVKVGIAPFGIWRPGNPPSIKGMDPYVELYADSRHWLVNGWLDYFTPQLYWKIDAPAQSYPVLLKWWTEQNIKNRHLWPGNYTSRVGDGTANQWVADEVANQVRATRAQTGAGGNIHFSARALAQTHTGLPDRIRSVYTQPALVPATPWLDRQPPAKPRLRRVRGSDGAAELRWQPGDRQQVRQWVVRTRSGSAWTTEIVPATQTTRPLSGAALPEAVAVAAVDRTGNEGRPALLSFK